MNEEELKKLWQSEQTAPTIDFTELQKSLNIWHDKLRRKVKIDIWSQIAAIVLYSIPVFFYPKLIFFALIMLILLIWYVPELRKLSKIYKHEMAETGSIKESLNAKISTMEVYFRRTKIAMYVCIQLGILAIFYVLHDLKIFLDPFIDDKFWLTFDELWLLDLIFALIVGQILIAKTVEITFRYSYKPLFDELKELLAQLESEE